MKRLSLSLTIILLTSSFGECQTAAPSLDQQARCAAQAEKIFTKLGWDFQRDSVQSHINSKLNRCFVEIIGHATPGSTSKVFMDAYEQREYATYLWIPRDGKKYWEVPPFECVLKPIGAPEQKCSTDEEYQAFVRPYLEN